MSKIGERISVRIDEPWDFEQQTKVSVLDGKVEQASKDAMLIVLSKSVTYQNVTFNKIVALPFKEKQLPSLSLLQITPVVQSVKLQSKELENAEFKPGSDFHRAASWRAWFLQGELLKT